MPTYTSSKHHLLTGGIIIGMIALTTSPARADNPFVQTRYTADPAPMVHEGKLYVYTSHDEDNTVNNFYTMNDWHLYVTEDMVNWTDLGSPASLDTFSWSTDNAWAPQGIYRNGKFFLYVPLNNNTGARIGVGVSDKVEGPFTDPLGTHLAAQGSGNIDPTVFIDNDGQAYMYWGNGTLRYVKLNENMISTSGPITNVDMPGFTEGPWLTKRGSLYYLIYAATSGREKITYATSNSPTGPWTQRGDIMDPVDTFTNHAGVVDYKGHSYFFYHNGGLPGGNDFRRSVCVEEFTYGQDGTIPKIQPTKAGPEPIETLNPFERVEAETIAYSSGLKTERCMDEGGGMNVRAISNDDYIKVRNVDFLDGVVSFEARVSSSTNDARIELHLDSQTGPLLGECDVSGASSWETTTCEVSGGEGVHDLFLVFKGGSGDLFKFNWWKFTGVSKPDNGSGGAPGAGGTDGSGGAASGAGGAMGASGGAAQGAGGDGAGGAPTASGGALTTTGGAGTGGAVVPGAGGAVATGGQPGGEEVPQAADGCSCHVGPGRSRGGASIALLAAASAWVVARRRRAAR